MSPGISAGTRQPILKGRPRMPAATPKKAWRARTVILCVVLLACIQVYLATSRWQRQSKPRPQSLNTPTNCKGWRETALCLAFGPRVPTSDKACKTVIRQGSGYCECVGGLTTMRVDCGHHRFSCDESCATVSANTSEVIQLPEPLVCKNTTGSHVRIAPTVLSAKLVAGTTGFQGGLQGLLHSLDLSGLLMRNSNHPKHDELTEMWHQIAALLDHYSLNGLKTPSKRTVRKDWVWQGRRMSRRIVEAIREKVQVFREAVPPYPPGLFKDKGIVIVGGTLRYLVPSWLAVIMLRKTGCQLPVEMWFPVAEAPLPEVEHELSQLGVTVRILDFAGVKQEGFAIKASVLLLSSFQEVLFLDADVTTVRDPTPLFSSSQYQETGALLWPDFWESTAAHQTAQILDIPPAQLPTLSFESGEMLVDKKRQWVALLLAVFMNSNAHIFHELLSCYLGKGDKETFAFSMLAAGSSFNLISAPIKPVGFNRPRCHTQKGACTMEFAANTMAQHGPQGELMFLHANMDKWGLRLPKKFEEYRRRWVLLHPDLDFVEWSQGAVGYDLEKVVFQHLQNMTCVLQSIHSFDVWSEDTGFNPYGSLQRGGFHAYVGGLQFRDIYWQGIKGSYLQYLNPTTGDAITHAWNRWLKHAPLRLINSLGCMFSC